MMSAEGPREGAAEVEGGATTSDRRVREVVVTGFAWTVTAAGAIWGSMYLALGLPGAAASETVDA